jgi:transcriptional regulator with XRE-family HTH domain
MKTQRGELEKKVRELRTARGWPQAQLAAVCGVDERTIRRIESGAVTPSLETLQALAQALETDVAELRRWAGEDAKPKAKVQIIPVSSGREFFGALAGVCASRVHADDAEGEDAERIKLLLDYMEYVEIWDEMSPGGRYDAEQKVSAVLRELAERRWYVGVARRAGTLRLPPNPLVPNQPNGGTIPGWVSVTLRIARIPQELLDAFKEELSRAVQPSDSVH